MKKRFKRVVEWEREPSFFLLFLFVINIISSFVLICIVGKVYDYGGNLYLAMCVGIAVSIFTAIICLVEGVGISNEVYWEEIK